MLDSVRLSEEDDIPIWDWNKNAQFSVKSVYKDLSSFGIDRSFKHLWKAKIPLKIKIWTMLFPLKIQWLREVGWAIQDVNFVIKMRPFIISSSLVQLPNLSGAVWLDLLAPIPDQETSPNFFGGFLGLFLPAEMFKF
jgi:hypothetical protein